MPTLETANLWLAQGRKVALATVVETWGSAPQPVGSQLVVDEAGNFEGAVSGGCVEGEVISLGQELIGVGAHRLVEFGVADETAWRVGLACGGRIRIYLEVVVAKCELLQQLLAARTERRAVAVVTNTKTGAQKLVPADAAPPDSALEKAFRFGQSEMSGDEFIAIHNPPLRLVIIGAVLIAQSVIPIARACGYDVIVIDPRSAFATKERFPGVTVYSDWPQDILPRLGLDARTAFIALTHDAKIDDPALEHALQSQVFYIGALGSRKTQEARHQRLMQMGFDETARARIHGPIGLAIGAIGSAEIALSIMAEITKGLRLGLA